MNRTLPLAALAWLLALSHGPAPAKDLLTPAEAQQIGMVESWHRQVGATGGAQAIVDMQLWVQQDTQRQFVEVFQTGASGQETVLERISTEMRDAFGNPIGLGEAERQAKLSVLKLKRRSIAAQTRTTSVNQVRLYVLSRDGLLSAYDAESGEQLWAVRLGNPALGYGTLGIDDHYVTVLNGTSMFQIRASDAEIADSDGGLPRRLPAGRPLAPRRFDGIPLHGAVHSGEYVIVPITRNGIETYRLDGTSIQPEFEIFAGQALIKPAVYPGSTRVMWPTDREFVYALETDGKPTMLFRLETQGLVEGGITAASDHRFFFGTTGGRVYGLRATRIGEVLWNQSLGEPFYQAPFVSQQNVLFVSSYGHLHNLSAETGEPLWSQPTYGVNRIFADLGNQLVGRDRDQFLLLIDSQSGRITQRLRNVRVAYPVINQETDRIYVVSEGGMVQCLRPIQSELPTFLRKFEAPPAETEAAPEQVEPAPAAPAEPAETPEPVDPFGGGADPFGGGDPFGGADPFGGGNGAADPFGN